MRAKLLLGIVRMVLMSCVLVTGFSVIHASAAETQYASAGLWPGVTWSLESPQGVALDAIGNAYVADTNNNRVVKFDAAGRYVTSWGGVGMENGKFNRPWDVACDPSGTTVFVSDTMNHRVQQFSVNGATVTFVRKWGKEGGPDFTGSNPGEFNEPRGIVLDGAGDVYVVDTKNYRVQKFHPTATGAAFVLQWGRAGSGPDLFLQPWAIDIGPTGTVYVLDREQTNCYVRAFTGDGVPVEFRSGGNGWGAYTLIARAGYFSRPEGIAVDDEGNVYVADNKITSSWVQKFTHDGTFVTGWGKHGNGDTGADGVPLFLTPGGMAVAGSGSSLRVVVADGSNDRLREFDGIGEPLKARDSLGVLGSHGEAWWRFNEPWDVEAGPGGSVYIADRENHRVARFSASGTLDCVLPDVIPTSARISNGYFNEPSAIAYDPVTQFVYVAEARNHRVQRLTADLQYEDHKWGAIGTAIGAFDSPQGIAVGPSPTGGRWVYVADTGNNRIQVFDIEGIPQTSFGTGLLQDPAGIVVDADGTVFVADSGHKRIAKFAHINESWTAWTLATSFGTSGSGDSLLVKPWGIAMDSEGYLYVSDTDACKVKKYRKATGEFVIAFGGRGSASGDLESPRGVAATADGIVYAADTGNHRYQAFVRPISINILNPTDGGCYRTAVVPSITFGGGAITSGIDLDGAPWDSGPIAAEGVHVLRAWARDEHGLLHEKTVEFINDYSPPVTYCSTQSRYSNQAIIYFTALDSLSGIGSIQWQLDGGPMQIGSSVVVGSHGTHTITYRSVDRAGNVESVHTVTFDVVDTSPPVTTSDAQAVYVDRAVITLAPNDPSAPCQTWYSLDAGIPSNGTVVSVSSLGEHTLDFNSTDALGNAEVTKTVRFVVRAATVLQASCSPSRVAYGGSATIGAALKNGAGATIKGQTLQLLRSYDGVNWTLLKSVSSASGSYSYSTNLYRKTYFKWQFAGSATLMPVSGTASGISQARLTEPVAPTKAYRGSSVSMSGYLKPKHTAGTKCVQLRAYRYESGKWVRRATGTASVSDYTAHTSKYRGRVVFKYRGKWRVRAYHADGNHSATGSTYDYITIK